MKPLQHPLGFCHVVQCDEPAVGTHGGFAAFCKAHLANPDTPCVSKVAGSAGLHAWVASHSPPPPERLPRCRTKTSTVTPVAGAAWPSSTRITPIDASTATDDSSAAPPIGTTAPDPTSPTPLPSSPLSSVSAMPSDPEPEPMPTTDSNPFEAASTSPSTIDPEATSMVKSPVTPQGFARAVEKLGKSNVPAKKIVKALGLTLDGFRVASREALEAGVVVRTGATSAARYHLPTEVPHGLSSALPEAFSSPPEAEQAAAPSICVTPDASAFPDGVPGVAIPDDPSHPRLDPEAPADDFTTAASAEILVCVDCGVNVSMDEDMCCAGCGRDLIRVVDTASATLLWDTIEQLGTQHVPAYADELSESNAQRLWDTGYRSGAGDKTTWLLDLVEKRRREFEEERFLRRLAEAWQLGAKDIPLPAGETHDPAVWQAGQEWRKLFVSDARANIELQQLRASLLTTLRSIGVHMAENVSTVGLYGALCEAIYCRVLLANQLGHIRGQVRLLRATREPATRELVLLAIEAALGLPLGGQADA